METLRHWFKNSSPIVKMFMAISITSAAVVANKWVYKPHIRRKRYLEAEQWASEIVDQEEQAKITGEPYTNNLRYM